MQYYSLDLADSVGKITRCGRFFSFPRKKYSNNNAAFKVALVKSKLKH